MEQDPFEQQQTPNDQPWPWPSCQDVPKWQLQTEQEQADQQQAIQAMEAKLARLKLPKPSYTPATSMSMEASDDDDEHDCHNPQEDQEGLPLLWRQRFQEDQLDMALQQSKSERQYVTFWCCCYS
ncbi:hypothetical protein DM01DRAFT_1405638 [Hesseltinella vesiculosa]|uniref:Uncharacterized protein n=1 Tax=Hesseltinella vesiculosa TaxID=101127 RepID=A0A1X2GNH7_9FUNG|nr:hypothetical protein DM01DRAFT_1405638 [Hesseltinella vesiculosa]